MEDSQLVLKFMLSAVELGKSKDGLVVNAAVIVDPSAKQVILTARDEVFAWNICKDNSSLSIVHPYSNRRGLDEPQLFNRSSNQLK